MEKPPVEWERITSATEKLWRKPWKEISGRHGDPGRELAMLMVKRLADYSILQ